MGKRRLKLIEILRQENAYLTFKIQPAFAFLVPVSVLWRVFFNHSGIRFLDRALLVSCGAMMFLRATLTI